MTHVNEKYWKSKIPLWMALLFLLNVFLIVAVELLTVYKYPAEVDEALLSRWDPAYTGCTVIAQDDHSRLNCYLAETAGGEFHLVAAKKHPIFHRRVRILSGQKVTVPDIGEYTELLIKVGLQSATVHVYRNRVDLYFVPASTLQVTSTFYTITAAFLVLLEIGIWELIRRNMR